MKKFEIGKEYFDTSACDHNCVFTIKIVKRTDKTVTFERNGKTRRTKLFSDERGEYIIRRCDLSARRKSLLCRFSCKGPAQASTESPSSGI